MKTLSCRCVLREVVGCSLQLDAVYRLNNYCLETFKGSVDIMRGGPIEYFFGTCRTHVCTHVGVQYEY